MCACMVSRESAQCSNTYKLALAELYVVANSNLIPFQTFMGFPNSTLKFSTRKIAIVCTYDERYVYLCNKCAESKIPKHHLSNTKKKKKKRAMPFGTKEKWKFLIDVLLSFAAKVSIFVYYFSVLRNHFIYSFLFVWWHLSLTLLSSFMHKLCQDKFIWIVVSLDLDLTWTLHWMWTWTWTVHMHILELDEQFMSSKHVYTTNSQKKKQK